MERGHVGAGTAVILVAALITSLPACGRRAASEASDRFTAAEADFSRPAADKVHLRALKQREGAPPARDEERLAAAFLPGIEATWRIGHELVSGAPARFLFEIGDRIDLRPEPAFPALGEATAPPAVFVRFSVVARPGEPFVVMVGHGGFGASSVRAVVAGRVDAFEADGATQYQPRAADAATGLPAAYVIDRDVPEAFRPATTGVFQGFATGEFGSDRAWLTASLPSDGWARLSSWISASVAGGSRSSSSNDDRSFATGDLEVHCDPIEMTVTKGGARCDWTTYPAAFWTVRMRAEPVAK